MVEQHQPNNRASQIASITHRFPFALVDGLENHRNYQLLTQLIRGAVTDPDDDEALHKLIINAGPCLSPSSHRALLEIIAGGHLPQDIPLSNGTKELATSELEHLARQAPPASPYENTLNATQRYGDVY